MGFMGPKDPIWDPLIKALLETGTTLAHPTPGS